jgi:hypothetical protein
LRAENERTSAALRRYAPFDDAVVSSHLGGRLTAGIYPLVDGDRCWLLACDFDKATWALGHHLPAVTFERCVRQASTRRWVGLMATPHRRDGVGAILHMQLGPVRHMMVSTKSMDTILLCHASALSSI